MAGKYFDRRAGSWRAIEPARSEEPDAPRARAEAPSGRAVVERLLQHGILDAACAEVIERGVDTLVARRVAREQAQQLALNPGQEKLSAVAGAKAQWFAEPGEPQGEVGGRACRQLGVNRPRLIGPLNGDRTKADMYGEMFEVIDDLAALGCGLIRQPEGTDPIWANLFPYVEGSDVKIAEAVIPPPAEIYERLSADGYAAFHDFGHAVIFCTAAGIRLIPTVFTYGGGGESDRAEETLAKEEWDHLVYLRENGYAPARHQSEYLFVSLAGWDPFYYDSSEIGSSGNVMCASLGLGATPAVQTYHRYVLLIRSGSSDEFAEEVDRRKELAVTAFAQALGEYLARLEDALRGYWRGSLASVVPYLECGNEMDKHWLKSDELEAGAYEYGRFHFLVAASVASAWPSAAIHGRRLGALWRRRGVAQSAGMALYGVRPVPRQRRQAVRCILGGSGCLPHRGRKRPPVLGDARRPLRILWRALGPDVRSVRLALAPRTG